VEFFALEEFAEVAFINKEEEQLENIGRKK
jgi:hypothetical protein